jgi:hypothetical protein
MLCCSFDNAVENRKKNYRLDKNRLFACVKDNRIYTSILLDFVLLLQRTVNTRTFCWALCFC